LKFWHHGVAVKPTQVLRPAPSADVQSAWQLHLTKTSRSSFLGAGKEGLSGTRIAAIADGALVRRGAVLLIVCTNLSNLLLHTWRLGAKNLLCAPRWALASTD
jgi:hypothetical protein